MKKLTVISFLFLLTLQLFAQDSTSTQPQAGECMLKFKITDWDEIPESDAKIVVTNSTATYKAEGVSDIDGDFQLIVPNGVAYDIDIYKFDTVFHFKGVETPAEPEVGYEFDITLKIKVVTEEYVSIQKLAVHFGSNQSILDQNDKNELDQLLSQLNAKPSMKIEIAAHTDNVGDDKSNMRLSQKRANSVKTYLESKGIAKNRIVSKGYGEAKPSASNDTPEGRAENRRVECRVISE